MSISTFRALSYGRMYRRNDLTCEKVTIKIIYFIYKNEEPYFFAGCQKYPRGRDASSGGGRGHLGLDRNDSSAGRGSGNPCLSNSGSPSKDLETIMSVHPSTYHSFRSSIVSR